MSKTSISTTLVFVLIAGLLFATNPNKNDYESHLQEQIKNYSDNKVKDNLLSGIIDLFSGGAAKVASMATEKEDFFFFSTYSTELDDNNRVKYLGILNHFVLMESEGELFESK